MPTPAGGITWDEIKSKLESEGAKNKQYDADLDAVIDLAAIPVLNWTKLQFFNVRQSVLANFSNPKLLIATSSMLNLLNSAEKVEAAAGNISATSQELTIVGGTATATGQSWVYWNLPESATRVYVHVTMANGTYSHTNIDVCDADGSTSDNPPDFFYVDLTHTDAATGDDVQLRKNVGGTSSNIATEAVDLTDDVYYEFEAYFEGDGAGNWNIKVWRGGVLKFDLSHTEAGIPDIQSVRLRCNDTSTTSATHSKFKGQVVIIYE